MVLPQVASAAGRSNYSFAVLLRVVFSQPSVSYQCGGTLVAPALVLTAAHCVAKDPSPVTLPAGSATSVTAFLGWQDMTHWNGDATATSWPGETAGAEVIAGTQWEWHQLFDTGTLNGNDVALIWLARPTAHAATATLQRAPLSVPPSSLLALGWGITTSLNASQGVQGATAAVLQRALLPTVDGSFCAAQAVAAGTVYDDSRQLCTGTTGGVDTCYVRRHVSPPPPDLTDSHPHHPGRLRRPAAAPRGQQLAVRAGRAGRHREVCFSLFAPLTSLHSDTPDWHAAATATGAASRTRMR